MVEDISLPLDRFGALVNLSEEQFGDLLYPLYERVAGQIVARARENISFGRADAPAAQALGIEAGAPVVRIDRTAFGHDGSPLGSGAFARTGRALQLLGRDQMKRRT